MEELWLIIINLADEIYKYIRCESAEKEDEGKGRIYLPLRWLKLTESGCLRRSTAEMEHVVND